MSKNRITKSFKLPDLIDEFCESTGVKRTDLTEYDFADILLSKIEMEVDSNKFDVKVIEAWYDKATKDYTATYELSEK